MNAGKAANDDSAVLEMVAELTPIWLPGSVVDLAQRTVEVGWGRGGLQMSAVVGLGEILDRCLQLPKPRWPEQIERWLRAVVAEGELATEEHRYGAVAERQRTLLVQRGWSARTAGPVADALLPLGDHFEVVIFVRTGAEFRRLTVVRRSMLGLGDPDLPSPVELTLAELADLKPVEREGFSVLHREGDRQVAMALVDRDRLLPAASTLPGLLIGVPRLSMIGYCPADAGQERANALARWIGDNHRGAPDQCSPDLFWLVDDYLVQVPITLAVPPAAVLPEQLLHYRRPRFRWPWRS